MGGVFARGALVGGAIAGGGAALRGAVIKTNKAVAQSAIVTEVQQIPENGLRMEDCVDALQHAMVDEVMRNALHLR